MPDPQLDWIPVYIDRLLSSPRWRSMKDYQRGWYWQLIIESVRSERPGYLRLDANLWQVAGACSRQYWESDQNGQPKYAVVLACFKQREIAGEIWIYNERLVQTLEEQLSKINKRRRRDDVLPSYSPSNFKEEEGKTPQLPASALARKICEEFEITATMRNLQNVTAAIEAVAAKQSIDPWHAFDFLMLKAKEAEENGENINVWWFSDSRWKHNGKGKPDTAGEAVRRAIAQLGE